MGSGSILHRPLRLPRFSLRGLLLFFPLVALFVASAANELAEYRRERAAWQELYQIGARHTGFDDARRSWGAWMLGPLLPEMDRISGMQFGLFTPRDFPPAELDRAFELLARLPRLRDLSLHGLPVTDRHVELLALLPELVHVDLQDTQITDSGLATLDRLPSLRYAMLAGTAVSDAALERLSDREKARYWLELKVSLEADRTMGVRPRPTPANQLATDSAYPPPTPAQELHVYAPVPQAVFDRLVRYRQVDRATAITLGGGPGMKDELLRLASRTDIELFRLAGWVQTNPPLDLEIIGRWTRLKCLHLPPSQIGARDLQFLQHCCELTELNCPSSEFDDEAAAAVVRNHPKLTDLNLGPCRLTDRGLAIVAMLPHLQDLRFQSPLVTAEGLEPLRAHPTLTTLELDWGQYPPQTRIDFEGIAVP